MKKLVLIDGYGFVFRAFFSVKGMTKKDGTPIGALYGFTKMLMNVLKNLKYSHIAMVFDTGGKNFRHTLYEKYKANRPPCPPELVPQFALVREASRALNVKILEKNGYEADDVIATYTKKAEKEGYEVVIVSIDKDLMQLVNDNVSLYDVVKDEIINADKVRAKWGVDPKNILDMLSLMGDASDNIPGVPSIGVKTAAELINEFGDIDNLLANLDNIKQEKRRNVLRENRENAILSRALASLEENVPLEECIDDLCSKHWDNNELRSFLETQEFYSIMKLI